MKRDYNWNWWPENEEEAVKMIADLKAENASISKYLPYADHGAYGQDKRRISDNWSQIRHMQQMIDDGKYA